MGGKMNTQTGFVNALNYLRERGYDCFMVYIQAVLESGNFSNTNSTKFNNFFNSYHFPNDGWTGETHLGYDTDENGNIVETSVKVYLTPCDCFIDYDKYIQAKFPQAYMDRADYKKFYTEIMTIKDGKAVYPSFCCGVDYSPNLIKLYEKMKPQNNYELYQIIHGAV